MAVLVIAAAGGGSPVVIPVGASGTGGAQGNPGGNVMAIGLFTGAALLTIAVGTALVQTSGYSSAGKNHALYVADAAVDSSWVSAHPSAGFVDAGSRGFRLSIEQPLHVGMFGAALDNATDDHAALAHLQTFRQAYRQIGTGFGYSEAMPRGKVPFGISYQGTTSSDLYGGGILEGDTGSVVSGGGSVLRYGASTTGIRLQYNNTTGETTYDASSSLNTASSQGTLLRNFTMEGGGGSGDHPGIRAKATFTAEDIFINGFSGAGITANCNIGDTTLGTHGNASSSQVWRCSIQNCGGDGVKFQGGDASIFVILGSSSVSNGGYGFSDYSEFGGVMIGCHSAGNTLGAYHTDPAQATASPVILGCYEEAGQPGSTFSQGTLIVGGSWSTKPSGGGYVYALGDRVRLNALGVDGNFECGGTIHSMGPLSSASPADMTLTLQSTNSSIIYFNRYNTSGVLQATDGFIKGQSGGIAYSVTSFHQFYTAGGRMLYFDNNGLNLDSGKVITINGTTVLSGQMSHITNLSAAPTQTDFNGLLAALQTAHLMA